jgi:hypothetical protein
MATTRPKALSDEQLADVLGLLEGADSCELKLTVPEGAHRSTVQALGMDPLEAQIRQVFFFDTPDLLLDGHGLVVRARRVQGKGDDSVVKLRPVVPETVATDVRSSASFSIEVDAMPGGYVCSGSMKRALPRPAVRETLSEGRPVRKLFSKEQRTFFAEHGPTGITLDELTPLGPLFVLKLRFTPPEFKRRMVAEMWLYPDGSRVLELSTKCAPGEAFQVATEARAFLAGRGVDLAGEQSTKTKKALRYFSRQLQAEDA